MTKHKKIPQKILMRVLVACARRCCLCFGLDGDFSEKKGQVAHIDRNPANHNEHNLVYLCLLHHDNFDSSTSQSKGIIKEEVLFYRNKLLETVKTRLPAQASDEHGTQETIATFLESVRHDQPFNSGMGVLPKAVLRYILYSYKFCRVKTDLLFDNLIFAHTRQILS